MHIAERHGRRAAWSPSLGVGPIFKMGLSQKSEVDWGQPTFFKIVKHKETVS